MRRSSKIRPFKLSILSLVFAPIGLFVYMLYLEKTTGDPLEFFHSIGIFGEQRSSSFILLPQVFYRYVFKILPAINYNYFPVVFTTWLEFMTGILFTLLSVLSFVRLRLSYAIYLAFGFLIPTLAGSFSSLPRYVLVLFPAYILMSMYLSKTSRSTKILTYIVLIVNLSIATALFTRGYWVS